MDIDTLVRTRRNIKTFTSEPVSREQLMTWFEAAKMAPNHKMTEPWEVVFVGPETRAKLNHKADFGGAPVVLAVLSKPGSNEKEHFENTITTACFIQNFLLLAYNDGVGARWASLGSQPQNREILEVPTGHEVLGVFGIGYPREVPEPKLRQPMADKVRNLP
ncbi:nitroreductase family protein [Alicyclobacillus sp. SO9]|uniref:nitroreductase family protein n=1 Tax=Alicyclobacillus sp. SO9 TaxID=2665646 RepID=UPI0018E860F1|nr:nitroreductase family protein [Alicyclobacillus sp. SO9]QQE80665.1 nitroreductase family protein [Alicyclobacillus sp. SO9]